MFRYAFFFLSLPAPKFVQPWQAPPILIADFSAFVRAEVAESDGGGHGAPRRTRHVYGLFLHGAPKFYGLVEAVITITTNVIDQKPCACAVQGENFEAVSVPVAVSAAQ